MQALPMRQGDMVIWSWGQLHGNTPNFSSNMRLHQYIRMLPADIQHSNVDQYACNRILHKKKFAKYNLVENIKSWNLTQNELKLLNVQPYD